MLEAENGAMALEVYRDNCPHIDLVLLDMSMPVMGGSECFKNLIKIDPKVCVIISSGYAEDPDANDLVVQGAAGFLAKPYDMHSLTELISIHTHPAR